MEGGVCGDLKDCDVYKDHRIGLKERYFKHEYYWC